MSELIEAESIQELTAKIRVKQPCEVTNTWYSLERHTWFAAIEKEATDEGEDKGIIRPAS